MKATQQDNGRVRTAQRVYNSPVRRKQADETRRSIADSADMLLKSKGYAGMTIEAIAQAAGVATQTVYAVFGSKRGILAELLDRASPLCADGAAYPGFGLSSEPEDVLKALAAQARGNYEAESATMDLLRGAGVVAPELAKLEKKREAQRHKSLAYAVELLRSEGRLRPGLSEPEARDVLWCLTSRDTYRMLVQERAWSPAQYESWLELTLSRSLLG